MGDYIVDDGKSVQYAKCPVTIFVSLLDFRSQNNAFPHLSTLQRDGGVFVLYNQ